MLYEPEVLVQIYIHLYMYTVLNSVDGKDWQHILRTQSQRGERRLAELSSLQRNSLSVTLITNHSC